jgi:hypothetical protein
VLFPSHTGVIKKAKQPEGSSAFSLTHSNHPQSTAYGLPPPFICHRISPSTAPHLPPLVTFQLPSSTTARHLPPPLIYHPPPTTPHSPHTSCLSNKPPNPLRPSTTKSTNVYAPTSPVPKLSSIASKKVNLTNRFRRERE